MNSTDYIQQAIRTNTDMKIKPHDDLLHSAMGISTEAGELLDNVKKTTFYGKPLDVVNLKEELGDMFWYAALLCNYLDTSFEEVMSANIDKLKVRYPEKWTHDKAINRNTEAEMKAVSKESLIPIGTLVRIKRSNHQLVVLNSIAEIIGYIYPDGMSKMQSAGYEVEIKSLEDTVYVFVGKDDVEPV